MKSLWNEAKPVALAAGSTTVMFTNMELALKLVIATLTVVYLSVRIYRMFTDKTICMRVGCGNRMSEEKE